MVDGKINALYLGTLRVALLWLRFELAPSDWLDAVVMLVMLAAVVRKLGRG